MADTVGRPTIYNEELADKICEAIATSTLGTNKLCKLYDWMPVQDTIYKWRYRHKSFAEKYALAKAHQAELMVEEIIDISDDGSNDTYMDEEGNLKVDTDVLGRSRLRVDTRKWYASKLAPKIYGDKSTQNHDVTIRQDELVNEAREIAEKYESKK